MTARKRLAIVASHPVQYNAPWFRALAAEVDLQVLFAHRVAPADQVRAGFGVGFDWVRAADVVDKIREEVEELAEVVASGDAPDQTRAEEEMGDLLFAIANLSRKLGIEPEAALRKANEKFTGPAHVSKASPDNEATATCCSAFVTFLELIRMASTAAADRFWPKIFEIGSVAGLGRSNDCAYWLREAAPSCVLVSSDLA